MRVDNVKSVKREIASSVPQKFFLVPIVFCMFNNDFQDVLQSSELFNFGDDTAVYRNAKKNQA